MVMAMVMMKKKSVNPDQQTWNDGSYYSQAWETTHGIGMMMAAATASFGGQEKIVVTMMVSPKLSQELCRGNVSEVHASQEVLQSLRRQCT